MGSVSSGNVVGIHYNNWMPLDKTNDYSFNGNASFTRNMNITVYADGILIYGIEPSDTGESGPSPDPVQLRLQNFALYSTEKSIVKDQCVFNGGGAIGSNGYVEIGSLDSIYGNIVAGGNIKLRSQCRIFGNVIAGDSINKEDATVKVNGMESRDMSVGTLVLPVKAITPGTIDVLVNIDTMYLSPGIYRNIQIGYQRTLKLSAGIYVFNNFSMTNASNLIFNITPDQKIDLQIQGEMQIDDRAKMKFANYAYAPSVQIYTNDPNNIFIGNDVELSGIFTAPLSTVDLQSRIKSDGAIYARIINIQPNTRISSTLIDPEGDADGDLVSNQIEVNTGTDPANSSSYIDIVIPSSSELDYSKENDITLDYATFYGIKYSKSDKIPFHIDTGAFNGDMAPLFQMRSLPEGFSSLPRVPGYTPVGLCMNFYYFPINPGMKATVPLPFTDAHIVDGTESFLVIRTDDSYDIMEASEVKPEYLAVAVDETVKSIIMVQKTTSSGSAVAYLDGGMIYSQNNGTSLKLSLAVRNCQKSHLLTASFNVYLSNLSDTSSPIDTVYTFKFDTLAENGTYTLINNSMIDFTGQIKVKKVVFAIGSYPINYKKDSLNCPVLRGQRLNVNMDIDASKFRSIAEPVTFDYGLNYSMESVSIDGDGRIMQTRNGDSVIYNYDFYLKDHLGSTRMVINDEKNITERMNYQAYGSIEPLDSAAPSTPAREKFTGKEYDIQGADFARFEYDVEVSDFVWSRRPGAIGALRIWYVDLASSIEYSKMYFIRIDSLSRRAIYTGSESFISSTEIRKIVLMANHVSYSIYNSATLDSFEVNPGETRRVKLRATSDELYTNADSSFYTISTPEDNTTYFSGTKLFYFGARYYDPELGIWLSVDPAEEFSNLYGYHSNPILFIDPTGEDFGISAAIVGAIIGAAVATTATTVSAVQYYQQTGYWNWRDYLKDVFIQSNIGGAVGFVSGGVGGAIGQSVTGAVGIASGSGLAGATAGGAVGGSVGGAIGYAGNYGLQVATRYQDWNSRQFWAGLGTSTLAGGILGGVGGALAYGINPNGVNQNIIKWGHGHDKGQGVLDFISNEYNLKGNYIYKGASGVSGAASARGYTPNGSVSEIYENAFYIGREYDALGRMANAGKFDPSSVIQVMHHEGFHQANFIPFATKQHLAIGSFNNNLLRAAHEVGAYANNYISSSRLGFSDAVTNYVYRKSLEWRILYLKLQY